MPFKKLKEHAGSQPHRVHGFKISPIAAGRRAKRGAAGSLAAAPLKALNPEDTDLSRRFFVLVGVDKILCLFVLSIAFDDES